MEVEDRLPVRAAARVEEVHAVGTEPLGHPPGHPLGAAHHRIQVVLGHLQEVLGVLARDDEQVPARRRVDVHEGDGALILVDLRAGDLARDDLAEETVRVLGHEGGKTSGAAQERVSSERATATAS